MDKVQDRMKKSGKYWIRLIKVNCANPTIQDQKLPECEKKRSFVASKMKGKVVQPYSLSELFSVSSFEAQVISFVYNHMVSFAQNEEEAYQAMEHVKGSKDLIFMYTKGYGSQDHYKFLKFAIDRFGKYQFLLCTDQGIIEKMFGKQKSDEFGLWYFECAKTMKGGQCPQHQFKGQTFPRPEVMESFLDFGYKAKLVEIKTDGTTDLPEGVTILYLIVDSDSERTRMLSLAQDAISQVNSKNGLIQPVMVDARKFNNLEFFGAITKDMLPTVAIELADRRDSEQKFFEHFPPEKALDDIGLTDFITNVVNDLDNFSIQMNDIYHVDTIPFFRVDRQLPNNKAPIFVAGCIDDERYQDVCEELSFALRHLARTVLQDPDAKLEFAYIDYTGDQTARDYPTAGIYMEQVMIQEMKMGERKNLYTNMLQFVNQYMKTNIKPVPASSCDLQPVSVKAVDKSSADVNKEDIDELNALQDDEIRKDSAKIDTLFYRDGVPKLTDQTFNSTLLKEELLAVLFFAEFDSNSILMQPLFSKINEMISKETSGDLTTIKLAKVDCFSEFNICKHLVIVHYPQIRIYSNGEHVSKYSGVLDEENILKALRLYQKPALTEMTVKTSSSFTGDFLAYFASKDQDFEVYKKMAEENYGKHQFAYVIDQPQNIPGVSALPLVLGLQQETDPRVMTDIFTEENLRRFVLKASIPLLDELHTGNFPKYKAMGLPFVIYFVQAENRGTSPEWNQMVQAAETNVRSSMALFAWMDMSKASTKKIRKTYLGGAKPSQSPSEIIMANHTNGGVYLFDGKEESDIMTWVKKCQMGQTQRVASLARPKWKPVREGFDFLYYIDNDIGGRHGRRIEDVTVEQQQKHDTIRTRDGYREPERDESEQEDFFDTAGDINVDDTDDAKPPSRTHDEF
ncbi:uncharacterized protein [Clytia hemisphaerica]|uniref:uncharacterized protein n=1 Tax=Clytia hemisphaerica TaxID=252671 RepID=UPI0034D3BB47